MISIIVPVYNVEKYITKCLNSIKNQSYKDIEVIMVDDGSTDGSNKICKLFEVEDSRFRLIEKLNGGVSSARNVGLHYAKGEWIGFVDSDDTIDMHMYETLLRNAQKYKADISCCGINIINESGEIQSYLQSQNNARITCYDREETLCEFFKLKGRSFAWSPWNKIFSRNVVEEILFNEEFRYHEDFFYNLKCILRAQKVVVQNCGLYNYQISDNSATHVKNKGVHHFDGFIISQDAISLLAEYDCSRILDKAYIYSLFVAINTLFSFLRNNKNSYSDNLNDSFNRCYEYIINSYHKFEGYLPIKYKLKYHYIRLKTLRHK